MSQNRDRLKRRFFQNTAGCRVNPQRCSMIKHRLLLIGFCFLSFCALSQSTRDTVPGIKDEDFLLDSTLDMDDLLNEMDAFLDSLMAPRSYFLGSVAAASNYFNYPKKNPLRIDSKQKTVFSPVVGYFHKSGPGLSLAGNLTSEDKSLLLYQFSVTPSFDFIKNINWIAGVSYTRFFTKDSLPFYTSPLENEYNAYFIWRKSWIQPGITLTYGHGSRSDFNKRERFIELLRRRKRGQIINVIKTNEEVEDFSVTASVRHSFYWTHILGSKNYIKLVPQIAFSAGTQKFGFNRSTDTYSVNLRNVASLLYNTGNVDVDQNLKFQPLSLSLYLRPEYVIGKFFIQPQFILDYYFPSQNLSAVMSLNAGFVLQ
jgi:hypothetical protein